MATQTGSVTFHSQACTDLQCRIRGEYLEMPGMRISLDQAARLWALDREVCRIVLDALVGANFLHRDQQGRYSQTSGGY